MRMIFIHGFGEKPSIFDKIHPAFNQEKLFIDNWEELGDTIKPNYKAIDYAKDLAQKYQIKNSDIVIGHSLGGWISYHLKYLTNCKSIQIASWTDMDRVRFPINNYNVIAFCVKYGLTFNTISKKYFIKKQYKGLPSESIFVENYERLIKGNNKNIYNQMKLILNGCIIENMPEPDLRIHSKADRLIRFPKQKCDEVNGDHFNLITHPEEVIRSINKLLNTTA